MPSFLSKLFHSSDSPAPKDGLTQPEREAIVEVLLYCMYADNNIALAEDQLINDTMSVLNWESGTTFDYFESRAIAHIREAKEFEETRETFFKSLQVRLKSKHVRALTLDLAHQLFLADGVESEKEAQLEAKLKQLLG